MRKKVTLGPRDGCVVFRANGEHELCLPVLPGDPILSDDDVAVKTAKAALLFFCPEALAIVTAKMIEAREKQQAQPPRPS